MKKRFLRVKAFREKPKVKRDIDLIPAKKHLGQNFLVDGRIKDRMIHACQFSSDDVVLEIGPGRGVLTNLIAPQVKKLYAVEADPLLASELKKQFFDSTTEVFEDDFLKFDMMQLPAGLKVVGNLPYNVATPIIEKIIRHREQCRDFFITVQLEHGLRMCAQPNTKDYGSLSCFVQFYAQPQLLFRIRNTAFNPVPKVQSCFMRLTLKENLDFVVADEEKLFAMIRHVFLYRRKTMMNALGAMVEKDVLEKALRAGGVSIQARPENLTLQDFVTLYQNIFSKS